MQKRDIIQKILSLSEAQGTEILNAANGVGWMGQASGMQQQVSEAIRSWAEHDDPQPLLGVVALFETLSMMSEQEAGELQQAILDVQNRSK